MTEETDPIYGATFEDLAAFLRRPEPGAYSIDAVRECVCGSCGGRSFEVALRPEQQAARRTCLDCGTREYIADSDEHWDGDSDGDTEVDAYCGCLCGEESFAGAVGFSLRDDGDVRWVVVGLRCLACGLLGVYEDWKINYGPSAHLLERA